MSTQNAGAVVSVPDPMAGTSTASASSSSVERSNQNVVDYARAVIKRESTGGLEELRKYYCEPYEDELARPGPRDCDIFLVMILILIAMSFSGYHLSARTFLNMRSLPY